MSHPAADIEAQIVAMLEDKAALALTPVERLLEHGIEREARDQLAFVTALTVAADAIRRGEHRKIAEQRK